MTTRVTIAKHPLHAMLVTLPIGMWVFSLACDIGFLATGDLRWETSAHFSLGGGIIGALLAAVPGFLDYLSLHAERERRVATFHLTLNLCIVVLQLLNFWMRSQAASGVSRGAMALSIIAIAALIVSGWLGGELVHVLGVTQPGHESHAPSTAPDPLQRH